MARVSQSLLRGTRVKEVIALRVPTTGSAKTAGLESGLYAFGDYI